MRQTAAISRTPWILSPWSDVALIVGTPLLVFLAISAALFHWRGEQITVFVVIWAIGHHLPGMMRAYGDRQLFAQFRLRFVLAPIVLAAVCLYAALENLTSVALVTAVWGWWHYLMQTYGFVRIYDAKAGSFLPSTRRLDKAMCLAWFGGALVLTPNGLLGHLNLYYRCGGPLLPDGFFDALRAAAAAALVVVTLLFAAHAVRQCRHGAPPSALKLLLMASTFAFFWYSLATMKNILVSYALFELFHDVQYLAIVWAFNRRRSETAADAGAFTRFVFRGRVWLVLLYVSLVFGYGSLNYFAKGVQAETLRHVLLSVFAASTLLHYYYDGFIWKLRETSTRQPLGIDAAQAAPAATRFVPRWGTHSLYWCLFLILVAGLTQMERLGADDDLDKHRSVAAALPDSPFAHENLGIALAAEGRLDEAAVEYRRALELNPHLPDVHYHLGAVLIGRGRVTESVEQFRLTLAARPDHVLAHYNLGVFHEGRGEITTAERHYRAALVRPSKIESHAARSLGDLLVRRGRRVEAIPLFERALRLNPDLSEAHASLGAALAAQEEHAAAIPHLRAALKHAPDSTELHYNLGVSLAAVGRLAEAETQYRTALKGAPRFVSARNNLGVVLAQQGKLGAAAAAFRQVLAIDPNHPSARGNLARAERLLGSER